jgi:glycosyltransferase involved in cell wall biosynthesis
MENRSYYTRDRNLLLGFYFLFYYIVMLGFFLDHRLLSQYRPIFFNYNRDLTELFLIATGLPRWMIAHPASFAIADWAAFLLPLPLLFYVGRKDRFSPIAGIVFIATLALYLLLADIFWQVHDEPFVLLLLLALAWTTNRAGRFYTLLTACRYYFLYIFVSAAIWKLARGAVFNSQEMSRILLLHHTDLLTGPCTSLTCRTYSWLIRHAATSQALYIGGALLEASFLAGFFTRRWDRWLIVLAVVFVIADLLVMRIPYWTILLGVFPLWLRSPADPVPLWLRSPGASRSKEKKIVLYETTHHENLPALLDLCEVRFNQVAVFLKELSYHNLTAEGSPEQHWPQTDFFIQTRDCPNRRFIRQLFGFVRRHGFTHLHLCTLDNNLLSFAVRLNFIGPVHLSLTVHEVNEYFFRSFRHLRDWTETIAKHILHRQIRHYHFFLPAMADQFHRRLPGSITVFIPSRFYSGHRVTSLNPPIRIVIPGSVDPNRRNYAEVIQTLKLLQSTPIELILLGDAATDAGAMILAAFQPITGDHLSLRHFKGYIPESTYEQELARAHLIWSPLNIHKKSSRNAPETYGLSTASGLTADLLLNNIPALVPAGFVIPEPFRPAIYPYRSPDEAQEIIRRLLDDPAQYAGTRETIHQAFSYFSKGNFSKSFEELMEL